MKCITIRQPWAWMIIHGGGYLWPPDIAGVPQPPILTWRKDVENRKWKTTHRGPLLIHAAQREIDDDDDYHKALSVYYGQTYAQLREIPDYLEYGSIIGRVNLVDILSDSESCWAFPDHWHWIIEDPQPIKPIPYRGIPGLFDFPDDLLTPRK